MNRPLLPALLATVVALGAPALAQTTETPAQEAPAQETPAVPVEQVGDLNTGEPVGGEPGVGGAYVAEVFGDWSLRCVRTESGEDPCQLYQLLRDQSGNAVAEISMFPLPEGQQAVAGATIITPLETLLTEQLTLRIDGGQAKRYPFTFCAPVGCVSRVGFLAAEVDAFRRGREATVRIVPAAAPDQEVILTVSLTGFTAGFNKVVELAAARGGN